MLSREDIMKNAKKVIEGIRDTRYLTCDIEEKLALAKMEVAHTRAGLFDASDEKTAKLYEAKLNAALEEYRRVLRISRERKVI